MPSHIRPCDPLNDLGAVADLIELTFGARLDPAGRVALEEMRRAARWTSWLGWLSGVMWQRVGLAPGFVWEEEGRVVGNVSLRRAMGYQGYFIGNVAVHPRWRRRGIATALMRQALREAFRRDAHWVGLEVRAENAAARHLYDRLGFREVGRTTQLLRPRRAANALPRRPAEIDLRRARHQDQEALYALLALTIPAPQRTVLELTPQNYRISWERTLDCWLEGRREAWWVAEHEGQLAGAVRASRERGRRPHRLEVLTHPTWEGRIEPLLVRRGLASLRGPRHRVVEISIPAPAGALEQALRDAQFEPFRVLVQMRRPMARRIPVRG